MSHLQTPVNIGLDGVDDADLSKDLDESAHDLRVEVGGVELDHVEEEEEEVAEVLGVHDAREHVVDEGTNLLLKVQNLLALSCFNKKKKELHNSLTSVI